MKFFTSFFFLLVLTLTGQPATEFIKVIEAGLRPAKNTITEDLRMVKNASASLHIDMSVLSYMTKSLSKTRGLLNINEISRIEHTADKIQIADDLKESLYNHIHVFHNKIFDFYKLLYGNKTFSLAEVDEIRIFLRSQLEWSSAVRAQVPEEQITKAEEIRKKALELVKRE